MDALDRVVESHQPKTPEAHTRMMIPTLKKTVCSVDGVWCCGGGLLGTEVGSSWSGVTGERCVPEMERNRSRKEFVECAEPRLCPSASAIV